jgi:hypothetical protein
MLETTQIRLLGRGVKIAVYITRLHLQRIALVCEMTQLVRWGDTRAAVPQIDTHLGVKICGLQSKSTVHYTDYQIIRTVIMRIETVSYQCSRSCAMCILQN